MYTNDDTKMFFDGLVELPDIGDYGWDWHVFRSYYDPVRKCFLYGSMSGCSCNSYEDMDFMGDHDIAYSKTDYMKAVSGFTDSDYDLDMARRAIFGL